MNEYGAMTLLINISRAAFLEASSIRGSWLNNSVSVGLRIAAASNRGAITPAVLLHTPIILILWAALSLEPIMVIYVLAAG